MRAIAIKGMKMPDNCGECQLMIDGWCYANGLYKVSSDIEFDCRPDFCPLIETEIENDSD